MMRRSGRNFGWRCRRTAASAPQGRRALCGFVLGLVALAISTQAMAQVIPPNQGAGRERERFTEPQPPKAQPGGPAISLPSTTAPAGAKKINIFIRGITIAGVTVYSEEQLAPLYEDLIGHRVPLQAVYDLAQRITAKYGADGYVLSRAVVPVQELNPAGANVRIEVVEGYVDKVVWPKQVERYRDFFTDYERKITAERPINIRTLERYLLLANDLPGLRFKTTLKASTVHPGASTLIVELTEKHIDAVARFDNRGTEARGPLQLLFSTTLNNLMGQHESLSLSYATVSPAKELQYVSANYRQVLNSEGLTGFINGSYSWSYPGTPELQDLEFKTRSFYGEVGGQYPIIRSRERNLNIVALAFAGENYNFWKLTPDDPQAVDRLRGVRVRLEGDFADQTQAITQAGITFSHGIAGLGSTDNGNILASRLGGRVDFAKVEVLVTRVQPLVPRFSALVAGYAQYSFDPLLVPEQCSFGGRVFGRAYDPSELLGDSCWMAVGELRYDLPFFPVTDPAAAKNGLGGVPPTVQLYGFTDKGKLYRLSVASVGTAASTITAASAGGGIRLRFQDYFDVDLSAAKAIEGPRDGWRYFFITTARY